MNAVQLFAFAEHEVRAVIDADGTARFVVADLGALLGYRDAANAARLLRDHQKGYSEVSTPGGLQRMLTCTQAGLNRLVLRSNAANAEQVQDWVESEVLPAIVETGSYSLARASSPAAPDLSTPAGVLAMAEQFTATARALVAASEKVAELEPKAEVADKLLNADGDLSVGDAAKALTRAGIQVGANRLFSVLETWKWVFRAKGDGRWRVMQTAINAGHMSVLPQSHYHPRTGVLVTDPPQPRLTPKGLARLLREHGVEKAEAKRLAEEMVAGVEA